MWRNWLIGCSGCNVGRMKNSCWTVSLQRGQGRGVGGGFDGEELTVHGCLGEEVHEVQTLLIL